MNAPHAGNDTNVGEDFDTESFQSSTFERWVFEIARFHDVFVRSGTRAIMDKGNPLQWFPYPNGFQSRGFNTLRDDFEPLMAMAVYGCFVNLVKLSTDPPRYGVLAHSDGQPYKLSMITRTTGAPPDLIITTIRWCMRVGWMTANPLGSNTAAVMPQQCRSSPASVPQQQFGTDAARREETQNNETQNNDSISAPKTDEVIIPEKMRTEAVSQAASLWFKHLERLAPNKVPPSGSPQLEAFWSEAARAGPDQFVRRVEHCMARGWVNLRDISEGKSNGGKSANGKSNGICPVAREQQRLARLAAQITGQT